MQAENDKLSSSNKITMANLMIRRNQEMTLRQGILKLTGEFHKEQMDYKEKCRSRIKNYLKISGLHMTEEEMDESIEGGNLFNTVSLMTAEKDKKLLFEDVKSRHEDIIKLEGSIRELHEMFQDLTMLVESQGEMADHIETNVISAKGLAFKALDNVKGAEAAKRRNIKDISVNNILQIFYVSIYYDFFIYSSASMSSQSSSSGSGKSGEGEKYFIGDFSIEIPKNGSGLTFYPFTAKLKIQKIDVLSCFVGLMLVGDKFLLINNKPATDAKQLNGLVTVKFRRDLRYKVIEVRREKSEKEGYEIIFLQLHWRPQIGLGIQLVKTDGSVIIFMVEPNSIISNHFFAGDRIISVNGVLMIDVDVTKNAFRDYIANSLPIDIKLERKLKKTIQKLPADVTQIMERRNGFWLKPTTLTSISAVDESKYKVYHVKSVESVPIDVDNSGNKLKKTPSRSGSNSSLDENKKKRKKR
uniref:t-SNARE coiled-coil homology domain-containing protein n=1 Tax=Meloidogyne javanica TaxID=6303 RepID=A0A915MHL2_MELJA